MLKSIPLLKRPKLMYPLLSILLARELLKDRNSSQALVSKNFTKVGLFHCKEGKPIAESFPTNLAKKYCSFCCFHDKKCSKPKQSCNFKRVSKWEKIPADDQTKILEHCHASGGKIWIDADNFAKHRITNIPMKFAYLLGDAKGPKSV